MYTAGKLETAYCDGYECVDDDAAPFVRAHTQEQTHRIARLPHSCDEWVIGGPEEVRALMHDLKKYLVEVTYGRDQEKKT